MKQNKNNRFAALLLALCMAVCCALPALAAPAASANIDLSRTGSMDVTLYDHQNDVPLRGGALTVYKVADVARTNGDLHFVYTADFTGCGIALGDLTDSTLASRLEAKLPARAAGTTHKISEQGTVSFDALPLGLYLVVQTENSKGYEAINSFLVSLPMADESGWLYTVDATPIQTNDKVTAHFIFCLIRLVLSTFEIITVCHRISTGIRCIMNNDSIDFF